MLTEPTVFPLLLQQTYHAAKPAFPTNLTPPKTVDRKVEKTSCLPYPKGNGPLLNPSRVCSRAKYLLRYSPLFSTVAPFFLQIYGWGVNTSQKCSPKAIECFATQATKAAKAPEYSALYLEITGQGRGSKPTESHFNDYHLVDY